MTKNALNREVGEIKTIVDTMHVDVLEIKESVKTINGRVRRNEIVIATATGGLLTLIVLLQLI